MGRATDLELDHLGDGVLPVLRPDAALHLTQDVEPRPPRWLVSRVVVLAAQNALGQGAEDGQADAAAAVEALELALDLAAVQHVVAGLLHDGWDQAQGLGDATRLRDLVGCPLGRAPVHGPALDLDDVVERPHRLLHRRQSVRPVRVHNVHVLEVKALEGIPQTLDDVLPRKAVVVDQYLAMRATPVDLREASASR